VQTLYPLNDRGEIDEKEIFKLVIGTLKCPLSYLDELTPIEIYWLVENHLENEEHKYEMISNSVWFGTHGDKKGKKQQMFPKKKKDEVKKISKDKRDTDKEFLLNVFAKEGGTV
jgi:hypothetical protein